MSTNPQDIHRSIEEHINKRCKEIIEKEKLRLNNEFNKKNSRVEELLDEISNTRKELDDKEELMVKNYKEKHGQLDASFKQDLQIWYNKDKGVNIQENMLDLF